jgi:hypothetical protein
MFFYSKSKLTMPRNLSDRILDIAEDIRSEIRIARDDASRRRLISWLSRGVPDPSEEHNTARAKHEETTGSWFLESDKFETWLHSSNSFLWLNGGGMWFHAGLLNHVAASVTKLFL